MIVEVEGLTKVFSSRRRGTVTAVDHASFTVDPASVVGLLGANGAGKTTTIKCMAAIVRPTSGTVRMGGVAVSRDPRAAAARASVVLEGNRNLYWRLTVRENVDFFAGIQGISRAAARRSRDELIERFGLEDKADTETRLLSRGMRQKLSLVCALVRDTPVLLLDEPTLGLDVETSLELRSYIRELARGGRTVLLSSHDMRVVQDTSDRVVVLAGGRVVADDTVPNLLALFRAQAYRFIVAGRLTADQTGALEARFPILRTDAHDGRTTIDVEFADDRGFYDLVAILGSDGSLIESVDREQPDLEQVFLKLIRTPTA